MSEHRPVPKPEKREKERKPKNQGSSGRAYLRELYSTVARPAYLNGLAAGQGRAFKKPLCERCRTRVASAIHHKAGRAGKLLVRSRYFMAVCQECHEYIHDHPEDAYRKGWMVRRNSKNES